MEDEYSTLIDSLPSGPLDNEILYSTFLSLNVDNWHRIILKASPGSETVYKMIMFLTHNIKGKFTTYILSQWEICTNVDILFENEADAILFKMTFS
jgi:hypothetical protein